MLAGAHANVKGLEGQFSATPFVLQFTPSTETQMDTVEPELVIVAEPVTVQLPITAGWNIPDGDDRVSVSLVAVN